MLFCVAKADSFFLEGGRAEEVGGVLNQPTQIRAFASETRVRLWVAMNHVTRTQRPYSSARVTINVTTSIRGIGVILYKRDETGSHN